MTLLLDEVLSPCWQVMGLEDWCVACEDAALGLRTCGDTIAFLRNLHRFLRFIFSFSS